MSVERLITIIAVMAVVTYLPRVLPIAILRRKIKNRFLNSFLTYMPYGVLAAMVFPKRAVFHRLSFCRQRSVSS